jgi:hypothetical protein
MSKPNNGIELYRLETKRVKTEFAIWTQMTRSLKNSGVITERRSCLSRPNKKYPEGKEFKWSWKTIDRIKPSDYPDYVEQRIKEGWILTVGLRRYRKAKAEQAIK